MLTVKFRTSIIAILVLLAGSLSLMAQAPVRGGDLPAPLPLFPPDNWWNTDISAAPVDSNSSAYISFVGATRGLHPDFGADSVDPSAPIYGFPYIVVSGSQPLVPVGFDYDDESDHAAPGRPPGYPIPEEAKTQQKWIEGGLAGGDPSAGGDRHMLVVDRDNRILFELYALQWNGSQWHGGSGAIFPLDSNARRPEGWTSADAAGRVTRSLAPPGGNALMMVIGRAGNASWALASPDQIAAVETALPMTN